MRGLIRQRNSTLAPMYAAPVLTAGVAGTAVAMISWQASVLLIVVAGGLLALGAAKVILRPLGLAVAMESTPIPSEDSGLRIPRLVYYLGAATIGFLTIRPALGFTASDWIFFLALGITCLVLLTQGVDREYLVPSAITIGVVLFSIGGLLSSFQAIAPLQSVSIVVRLLYLTIVWFWLGTVVLQSRKHVEYAVLAWVVSAALSAGGAVLQLLQGDVIAGGLVAWGRMSGFTPHYNNLGGLAATAFVPALMLAVDARGRGQRAVAVGSMALIGGGLLLSGSVGGLAAATVATILWLVLRGVTRRTVVIMAAAIASAFMLMSASTDSLSPLERVRHVTATDLPEGQGGSVYTRFDGYGDAWARIQEQPFVGVGLDGASSMEVLGPVLVHNIVISPWFSAGILGLVGIALLVGGTIAVGAHLIRHKAAHERSFVAALFSGFIAFVVFAMGEPILYVRYGWFPAAILLVFYAQDRRAAVQRSPAPGRQRPAYGRMNYEPVPEGRRS